MEHLFDATHIIRYKLIFEIRSNCFGTQCRNISVILGFQFLSGNLVQSVLYWGNCFLEVTLSFLSCHFRMSWLYVVEFVNPLVFIRAVLAPAPNKDCFFKPASCFVICALSYSLSTSDLLPPDNMICCLILQIWKSLIMFKLSSNIYDQSF